MSGDGKFACQMCGEELYSYCDDCYTVLTLGHEMTTDEKACRSAFEDLMRECRTAGTHLAFFDVVCHLADAHRQIIAKWPFAHYRIQRGKEGMT